MGKHDSKSHVMHFSKRQKFTQAKPAAIIDQHVHVPHVPKPGHSAHSQFK